MRAAANYRNPDAQFEMGKMFLKGEGGVKVASQLPFGANRPTGKFTEPPTRRKSPIPPPSGSVPG